MNLQNKKQIKTISASEFESDCLKLVDAVVSSGEEVLIARKGHPVARLSPYHARPKIQFGVHAGKIKILGDIVEPLDVEWHLMPDDTRFRKP